MKKRFLRWQLVGIIFTIIAGVMLHFVFEWSGNSILVAPFSGVNESVWEHLKLIFFPMVVYAIFEFRIFKEKKTFWSIKLKGILLGIVLIPILYSLYNGVIGKSPDWINISIFVISVIVAYSYEVMLYEKIKEKEGQEKKAIVLIVFIAFLFILFTFAPLKFEIFKDPMTGEYGITFEN